jgi:hypothetical protein
MMRALVRRAQRMFDTKDDLIAESKWTIWCFYPQDVPATIDFLIAHGTLSESDRSRCVHWWALGPPSQASQEDIAKTVDAEQMLKEAGIRTVYSRAWEAHMQGPEAFKAFWRDRYGKLDSDDLKLLEEFELVANSGIRERGVAAPPHATNLIARRHAPE